MRTMERLLRRKDRSRGLVEGIEHDISNVALEVRISAPTAAQVAFRTVTVLGSGERIPKTLVKP